MSLRTRFFFLFLSLFSGILLMDGRDAFSANGVTLYTPCTKISVRPGESIDYTIDVINKTGELQNVDISLAGLPKEWDFILKSGGWNIRQISVLPGEKKSLSLKVEVPLEVNKGNYRFRVLAGEFGSLPLVVEVSEQGTFKTEFTTNQSNMEGHANANFTFKAALKNRTADKQLYALMANAPRGWDVTFKADFKPVTSVDIEANSAKDITIEIKPPEKVEAGKYKIPVGAATNETSATLDLEVAITGSYDMELTTPRGLLSAKITAGHDKKIELIVRNTGSSELTDIKFSSSAPLNWDVLFDPKSIDRLEPGKDAQVYATIKADNKAIAGDYVTNMEAKTPEASSKASFRISVKTPMIWGWVGILIILGAMGGVYYLFHKFGRR
jgi:uncharacterized membrane protein